MARRQELSPAGMEEHADAAVRPRRNVEGGGYVKLRRLGWHAGTVLLVLLALAAGERGWGRAHVRCIEAGLVEGQLLAARRQAGLRRLSASARSSSGLAAAESLAALQQSAPPAQGVSQLLPTSLESEGAAGAGDTPEEAERKAEESAQSSINVQKEVNEFIAKKIGGVAHPHPVAPPPGTNTFGFGGGGGRTRQRPSPPSYHRGLQWRGSGGREESSVVPAPATDTDTNTDKTLGNWAWDWIAGPKSPGEKVLSHPYVNPSQYARALQRTGGVVKQRVRAPRPARAPPPPPHRKGAAGKHGAAGGHGEAGRHGHAPAPPPPPPDGNGAEAPASERGGA
ncbi:hypothetical protein T484DRAFT_1879504, partial [Baffinella frigidus]